MLYIIPPLSCPELCRRSKGRLGGDGQPPRISRISTDNLSFKIRYVKILVIRWRDSAANKKPLLSFGRICNPTVLSICIYNAKTTELFDAVGLQIRLNGKDNGAIR
jgi:hypothetical protein